AVASRPQGHPRARVRFGRVIFVAPPLPGCYARGRLESSPVAVAGPDFVVACGTSGMRVRFGSFMANPWARSFLARCAEQMKGILPDGKSAANRIRDNAQALFRQREPFLPDQQARAVIAPCCLVLAAYREARARLAEHEAFELVRTAVFRT